MDFKDALAWQGIDPSRPVVIPAVRHTMYGYLRENAGKWLFDGFQVGNPGSFARDMQIRILLDEPFGYPLSSDPDYGLTEQMQKDNPFVGTTHYPNLMYQSNNISRLKYWWLCVKSACWILLNIPKL